MSGRTRFRADGSAVYMVTPSGKQLCVAPHTDWISAEYIAATLQDARDRESALTRPPHWVPLPVHEAARELVKIRYGPEAEVRPLDIELAKRILVASGLWWSVEPVLASERGEEGPG